MEFGISTSCLKLHGKTILEHIAAIKDASFDILEFDANNCTAFPYKSPKFIEELRQRMLDLQITLHSIHAPFHHSISDPDRGTRRTAVQEIIEVAETCFPLLDCARGLQHSDTPVFLVIHAGHHLTRTSANEQFYYCLESLEDIVTNMPSCRFRPCLENMLSSHFAAKSEELIAIINNIGVERISICLDTAHAVYDSSPEKMLEELFPYIATTHISDNFNQPYGEFHAIPMTILHSRINWPYFIHRISQKLDRLILELTEPQFLENDIFFRMARLAAEQARRFLQ